MVTTHTFDPSAQEAEADLYKFESNLVYRVDSRTGGLNRETLSRKKQNKTNIQKTPKKQKPKTKP